MPVPVHQLERPCTVLLPVVVCDAAQPVLGKRGKSLDASPQVSLRLIGVACAQATSTSKNSRERRYCTALR